MKNSELNAYKPLTGYEEFYEISPLGIIRSFNRTIKYPNGRIEIRKSRILKPVLNKRNGYLYIGLTKNLTQKLFRLHRVVAENFIPNPNNLPEVNHEDYNKQNNTVENLVWCDRFYQNQHSAKKPNRKWQSHRLGKTGKYNPKSKPVEVKTIDGELIGIFESGILAAKATNSHQTKVSSCCIGKRKSHNNLIFRFI